MEGESSERSAGKLDCRGDHLPIEPGAVTFQITVDLERSDQRSPQSRDSVLNEFSGFLYPEFFPPRAKDFADEQINCQAGTPDQDHCPGRAGKWHYPVDHEGQQERAECTRHQAACAGAQSRAAPVIRYGPHVRTQF